MKRLVILLVLVLSLVSFASATTHPICNPGNDPNIHGVYINGECYDCGGVSDLVCPEHYGAVCGIADPDCAVTPQAFWSLNNATSISTLTVNPTSGKIVYLVASGISDGTVTFHIWEDDGLIGDDDIRTLTAVSSNGKAIATWKINQTDLAKTTDYEDFYFKATGTGVDLRSLSDLNITTSFTGEVITQCSNYTSNTTCIADSGNVGSIGIVTPRVNGSCYYDRVGKCAWNGTICQQTTNETARSGNPLDCSAARGSCIYGSSQQTGDCSIDDFFTISYTSTDSARCPAYNTGFIPCPAQVRLPFFSLFNIIASLSIISIIYAFFLRKLS